MYQRLQKLKGLGKHSCFLWGPRQTGKSTLLKHLFPKALYYDLLLPTEFRRFSLNVGLLHDELLIQNSQNPVIIDEIQKLPYLLDEVQWFIVNRKLQFLLCGSSARKLKRGGGNLLGGRAIRFELFPLVAHEIPAFDLLKALNHGLLPSIYDSQESKPLLEAYVGNYLKEEIQAEGLIRNIPAFNRFLQSAAFSNGEILNFNNVARECGVSSHTAKDYFQILEDTLLGRFLFAYLKRPKRRIIHAPKFYFFDVGIANTLLKRGEIREGSEIFGKAFEHFIYQELVAHSHYSGLGYPIAYWRTTSGYEVDFILGDHEVALEIKGVAEVQSRHLKGLKAFNEEYKTKKSIIVSLDTRPRLVNNILILPWQEFLAQLWGGRLIK